jgi:hypothetical protein
LQARVFGIAISQPPFEAQEDQSEEQARRAGSNLVFGFTGVPEVNRRFWLFLPFGFRNRRRLRS